MPAACPSSKNPFTDRHGLRRHPLSIRAYPRKPLALSWLSCRFRPRHYRASLCSDAAVLLELRHSTPTHTTNNQAVTLKTSCCISDYSGITCRKSNSVNPLHHTVTCHQICRQWRMTHDLIELLQCNILSKIELGKGWFLDNLLVSLSLFGTFSHPSNSGYSLNHLTIHDIRIRWQALSANLF